MPNPAYGGSFSLCLLSTLPAPLDNPALTAPRVRFVARVVGLKLEHSLVLVEDEGKLVLVEIEQAMRSGKGVPPGCKDRVMVWGEVLRSADPLPMPSISAPFSSSSASSPPSIDPHLFIRAMRILELGADEPGVMEGWREGVKGVQEGRRV
ncbi:hypothetical protein JCM11251_007416 [Rhodosporidiobolus azoricus]